GPAVASPDLPEEEEGETVPRRGGDQPDQSQRCQQPRANDVEAERRPLIERVEGVTVGKRDVLRMKGGAHFSREQSEGGRGVVTDPLPGLIEKVARDLRVRERAAERTLCDAPRIG